MKTIAIAVAAALAFAAPAHAQELEPSPALLRQLTKLGAAAFVLESSKQGNSAHACTGSRVLLWIQIQNSDTETEQAFGRRMINQFCR